MSMAGTATTRWPRPSRALEHAGRSPSPEGPRLIWGLSPNYPPLPAHPASPQGPVTAAPPSRQRHASATTRQGRGLSPTSVRLRGGPNAAKQVGKCHSQGAAVHGEGPLEELGPKPTIPLLPGPGRPTLTLIRPSGLEILPLPDSDSGLGCLSPLSLQPPHPALPPCVSVCLSVLI